MDKLKELLDSELDLCGDVMKKYVPLLRDLSRVPTTKTVTLLSRII
jgi:hypothetical protein